jgi:hypothetical protein
MKDLVHLIEEEFAKPTGLYAAINRLRPKVGPARSSYRDGLPYATYALAFVLTKNDALNVRYTKALAESCAHLFELGARRGAETVILRTLPEVTQDGKRIKFRVRCLLLDAAGATIEFEGGVEEGEPTPTLAVEHVE